MKLNPKITSFIGISALTLCVSVPAFAQMNRQTTPETTPNSATPNAPAETTPNSTNPTAPATTSSNLDREFIRMAAEGNNAEIKMSQLALQKAQSEQVRQYAQQMIDQHTTANQQLEPLAAERGIDLSTDASSFDTAVLEQLSQVPSAEFDQAYMNAQVNGHLKSAAIFRTGAQQVKDTALQNYALTLLPSIQQHLEMASQMTPGNRAERVR
ncbi:MAG TPA: DUF4142 domain-containing protein [Allocoleopsis sp.]